MIKVSVIIPVYNVERYLEDCLNSVVEQTLKEIEIICVDDASEDNSLQMLQNYAKNDSRITIIALESNYGLAYVRNRGMEKATGKYIYFLDSDDMIAYNALEKLYGRAEMEKLDGIFFDCDMIFENKAFQKKYKNYPSERKGNYTGIWKGKELFIEFFRKKEWTPIVQRQIWKLDFLRKHKLDFLEGIVHEDELFSFKASMYAEKVCHMTDKLFYRRIRENSIMTVEKNAKNFYGIFKSYYLMTQFVYENELVETEIQRFLAKMYHITVQLYNQLRNSCDLSDGFETKDWKSIYYYFCAMQKKDMYYAYIYPKMLEILKNYESVYIYGAGIIGKSVFEGLEKHEVLISGFVVSSIKNSSQVVKGHKVIEVDELEIDNEKEIILVAVNAENQKEIVAKLRQKELNYIEYDKYVE